MTGAPQTLSSPDVVLPATLHATAVAVGEQGLLIRGKSGAGKSSLARALLEAARQHGLFARLIGDDRVRVLDAGSRLIARPHPKIAGLAEVRGQGIYKLPHEPVALLHAVIDLTSGSQHLADHQRIPEKSHMQARFGGIMLPRLTLPAERAAESNAADVMIFLAAISPPVSK